MGDSKAEEKLKGFKAHGRGKLSAFERRRCYLCVVSNWIALQC